MPLQWLTNNPSFIPQSQPAATTDTRVHQTPGWNFTSAPISLPNMQIRSHFRQPFSVEGVEERGLPGVGVGAEGGEVDEGKEGGANSVWWQNRWKPFKTVSPRSALGPSLTELPRISWLSLSRRIMHYRFFLHLPFCPHPLTGQAKQQESSGTMSVPFVTTLSGKARAGASLDNPLDW